MDRVLGLLAAVMEDPALASGHFEDAVAFCRRSGNRPELAWTCVDYAHALFEQDRRDGAPGNRSKATALLDEGLRIARELGMKPLVERALRDKDLLTA